MTADTDTRTLEEIMRDAKITAATHGERDRRTVDGWDHYASTFDLIVNGELLISRGSYRQGLAHENPPTSAEIFGSIVMDVQSVAPYMETPAEMHANVYAQTRQAVHEGFPPNGWEEWAEDLGLMVDSSPREIVQSMRDFQEIVSRAAVLRDRLTARDFDALLALEI